ncbi:cold shock domain-containing protein [Bradyrhizobium roseum]|uniref:cold shock domain-containing protein n=1 Tax=Bradyrhizobium roseum TaxID=3056648 RepID=UPI002612724B|nr:cold shock domain-containing protein [Bradyrhizobium roseus]WKA30578.1 cold shock domain-containing protein [Bradyrhizobium roseus]
MPTGVVRVFHRSKGYGFIRSETGGEDIFVHRRALEAAGINYLRKGHRVSFDQANDLGRPFATNLRLETKRQVNGASVGLQDAEIEHAELVVEQPDKPVRKPIARVELEQSLADAVRSVAPECQALVGVIIERVVSKAPDGSNWAVKGVRYGRADRDRCEAALGVCLREKQLEYVLSDEPDVS